MTDKTELQTTQPGTIATLDDMITIERPAGKDEGVLGTEGIGRGDILIPRLALAQKMSPEIDKTNAKYIEGLEFMDLFHSSRKEKIGRGPLHFAILRRDDPRWMEWRPLDQGGGIIDPNVPFGDPRTAWGLNGEKPRAQMYYDFFVLMLNGLDLKDPLKSVIALSMKSSAIKAAKHLNFLISTRGQKLICKSAYKVTTGYDTDKKSGGTYATYVYENAGWLKEGSAVEKLAVEMFEGFKNLKVDVDRESGDETDFDTAEYERESAGAGAEM